MRRLSTVFLSVLMIITLTACSPTELEKSEIVIPQQPNETVQTTEQKDIDYDDYVRLVNEYFDIYGGLVVDKASSDGERSTAGFCYAELTDLNSDGVLELVLVGVKDDMGSVKNGESAIDLYYGYTGGLSELVSVYTLSDSGEALLIDEMTLSSHGNGGVRFGIEYATSESTYILNSIRSTDTIAVYYELIDSKLTEVLKYETKFDYDNGTDTTTLNGQTVEEDVITEKLATYGEVVMHPISWLTEQELEQLKLRNEETFAFLEQYAPINRVSNDYTSQPNMGTTNYSPYSNLFKAYELDYNKDHLGPTDYRVVGMSVTPTYPDDPNSTLVDAGGFCYANLVDLNDDGVLEFVLIAYNQQEQSDEQYNSGVDKVYLNTLDYPNIIKVYTIAADSGLTFLGSLPVSEFELDGSNHYGIEYVTSGEKTYISQIETTDIGDRKTQYYELVDGVFGVTAVFEENADETHYIDGKKYNSEAFEEEKANYGVSELHLIQNLDRSNLAKLKSITDTTVSFLEDYPLTNFEAHTGAYNDGQFYYLEHNLENYYPPMTTINDYYRALTQQDYVKLGEILEYPEAVEATQIRHTSNEHAYVPGYIISQLQTIEVADVKNTAMATDIADLLDEVIGKNVVLLYAAVNEVLDPHKARLGLQVAGDIYDTYFILASDNPDSFDWKIEYILDDKFYPQ